MIRNFTFFLLFIGTTASATEMTIHIDQHGISCNYSVVHMGSRAQPGDLALEVDRISMTRYQVGAWVVDEGSIDLDKRCIKYDFINIIMSDSYWAQTNEDMANNLVSKIKSVPVVYLSASYDNVKLNPAHGEQIIPATATSPQKYVDITSYRANIDFKKINEYNSIVGSLK